VNLSADLGEAGGEDEAVLRCIDSASVACGVHAGSASVSIATALRCKALGVEVGAHPGYDDRPGFGRVERPLSASDIEVLVAFQVAALAAVAPIAFVKLHGALYHRCQQDAAAAAAVVRIARRHGVGIVAAAGEMLAAARREGLPAHREGFADRRLLPDGSLAPRNRPDALLSPGEAASQAVQLARSGLYDSLCLHGDTPGAGAVAAAIREAFREAGIETGPLVPR
jgi:UPF0271 protein